MKSAPLLPSEATKILLICRHAKSSWGDGNLKDRERLLNKRGERDAPEMGRRLVCRGVKPDLIMSSPAVRAIKTAEQYALELHYPTEKIRVNPKQYAASPADLLTELHRVEGQHATLLLVGHNPESTELANVLGNLAIDNIPTSGIVALALSISAWKELAAGRGALLFFDFPKNTL